MRYTNINVNTNIKYTACFQKGENILKDSNMIESKTTRRDVSGDRIQEEAASNIYGIFLLKMVLNSGQTSKSN